VVYTTPSSRVGADYGSKRVHFKLVNPKVTNIDSPKNYGKRIKDWMRDSSDDDLANDRNRPKDSFKQSREAIRGGSKVIRVPDAHGGHDEPKKGNRGSYILLDKEVANRSIDRNPQPTIRSKDKKRRTQTQPRGMSSSLSTAGSPSNTGFTPGQGGRYGIGGVGLAD